MAKNLRNTALMVGIVALGGINYSNPAHSSEDEQSEVPLWATKADGYYEAMAEAEEASSDASAEDEQSDVPLWATKADGYYDAMADAASSEESTEESAEESSDEDADEDEGGGFLDALFSDDDE